MNRSTLYAAFLLCVLVMHTMSHSLIVQGVEFQNLQTTLSEQMDPVGSITSYDTPDIGTDSDYKPPKHSFTDYSTFLSPRYPFHAYHPTISRLTPHERLQTPPEVFLEIDVPPDHA